MDARLRAEYAPPLCERTPPSAPLRMPKQKLSAPRLTPAQPQRGRWRLPFVVAGALLIAGSAVTLGANWFATDGVSVIEALALALTFLNVFWIAAAAITAVAGGVILWSRPAMPPAQTPALTRTALVFPIYNEDFRRVVANAEDLTAALAARGDLKSYEFFFLSDSNAAHAIEAERTEFYSLVMRHPEAPFYYRRRVINHERKVGNIADFITNWGARYDFMVVFDADSVMTPGALAAMTARMAASPQTAIIQTVPKIINARSRYARMQQFALNTYGPLFGAGMAWWSGDAGNYWGHNAIVRVSAFARHAGLPTLPGAAPFGGAILSHDFIEAAMLRRAGWRIEMAQTELIHRRR